MAPQKKDEEKMGRRDFIKILAGVGAAAIAGGAFIYNMLQGNSNPTPTTQTYFSYCGADCPECPHYQKTCDGCLATSERIVEYAKNCSIRSCAREKKLENCAYCATYGCDTLRVIHDSYPLPKDALDELRKKLNL